MDPLLAPGRSPLDLADSFEGLFAEAINGGKPLLRSPEKHGLLAAPAVGILVLIGRSIQQNPFALQRPDHRFAAVGIRHPGKLSRLAGEMPAVVNGAQHRQPVEPAHLVVFQAVPRSGMDTAGALLQGDMLAQDER